MEKKSKFLEPFAKNLRYLCANQSSVSLICRELGINRQQFARYLTGKNRPSAFNMRKIEVYFELPLGTLYLEEAEFQSRFGGTTLPAGSVFQPAGTFVSGMQEKDLRQLRPYLGYYHSYFYSFAWSEMVLKTLVWFYQKNNQILSKTVERIRDPATGERYVFKYHGNVIMTDGRIYVIDSRTKADSEMAMTILYGTYRGRATKLSGLTMGSSSASRHDPAVARVVYSSLGPNVDVKQALRSCGLFVPKSREIPPGIPHLINNILDEGQSVLTARHIE